MYCTLFKNEYQKNVLYDEVTSYTAQENRTCFKVIHSVLSVSALVSSRLKVHLSRAAVMLYHNLPGIK